MDSKIEFTGKYRLSIILPAYNCEKTIKKCLESLLSQTIIKKMAVEILVVDDGSTDNTQEIIKRFPVKLIKIMHSGRSLARNTGYQKSSGDLIFFAEADAYYQPEHLECLVEKMIKHQRAGTVIGLGEPWPSKSVFYKWWKERYKLSYVNYKPLGGFMFRRSDLEKIGLFDPSLPRGEDYELCNRLKKLGYIFLFETRAKWWHKEPCTLTELFKDGFDMGLGSVKEFERKGIKKKRLVTSIIFIMIPILFMMVLFNCVVGIWPFHIMLIIPISYILSHCIPIFELKNKNQGFSEYMTYIILYPIINIPKVLGFSLGYLIECIRDFLMGIQLG